MIKIFVTGDVHIGKTYDRYPEIREELVSARINCLKRCVLRAEEEHCDLFAVTGDLFDNTSRIRLRDVEETVGILSGFGGRVLVIPGNHDYYTGEEKLWRDFEAALGRTENDIMLMKEFRPYTFEVGEETVTVYPAYCQSKHSHENNLGWIRELSPDGADYRVGMAHGTILGVSPDENMQYFPMSEKELGSLPADVWLIGHTHVPYPSGIREDSESYGFRILNAGTPQQTDFSNGTPGKCFIVGLDKKDGAVEVCVRSFISGGIRFFDIHAFSSGTDLRQTAEESLKDLPDRSVVRLTLAGPASREDYEARDRICSEVLSRFLSSESDTRELYEVITRERIRSDFAEIGFAAAFLEALDDPIELQMAYGLIRKYQDRDEGGLG